MLADGEEQRRGRRADPYILPFDGSIGQAGQNDLYGVEQAKALLRTALDLIDRAMATKICAMGDTFSMADCAAAPQLFYANMVMPFGDTHKNAAAYLARLEERPSFARVLKEAQPYLALMPK